MARKLIRQGVTLKLVTIFAPLTALFIALLVVGLHAVFTLRGDATAINYAGQIRYRSYQLGALMMVYPTLQGDAREKAHSEITYLMEDYEKILYGLRDGNESLGLKGFRRPKGEADFNSPWWQFDRHIKVYNERIRPQFLHILEGVGGIEETSLSVKLINKEIPLFVNDVDRTVSLLSFLSEKKLAGFKTVEFALLGVFLGVVGGSFFMLSLFVRRPLLELSKGVTTFSGGNLSYRIPVRGRDELGALAQSFNTMAEGLERQKALEAEVEGVRLKLFQAQRKATIAQLIRNLAHDIKTPLAGVLLHSGLLLEETIKGLKDTPTREDLAKGLKMIQEAICQCQEKINKLLKVSEIHHIKAVPTDLNKVLREVLAALQPFIVGKGARLKKELSATLPKVLGNYSQLEIVFMNILTNALEAIPEGGTITIKTRHIKTEDKVEVVIADTGCGIARENLPKLFQPFFTTKPKGKGTGLGLSISQEIVRQYKGNIKIDSEAGKGTTVVVTFPPHQQ